MNRQIDSHARTQPPKQKERKKKEGGKKERNEREGGRRGPECINTASKPVPK